MFYWKSIVHDIEPQVDVKELPIHIDCTWLADSMNTRVDRVVVWEGLIPLSGFICKSVLIKLVREFQNLWLWQRFNSAKFWRETVLFC